MTKLTWVDVTINSAVVYPDIDFGGYTPMLLDTASGEISGAVTGAASSVNGALRINLFGQLSGSQAVINGQANAAIPGQVVGVGAVVAGSLGTQIAGVVTGAIGVVNGAVATGSYTPSFIFSDSRNSQYLAVM